MRTVHPAKTELQGAPDRKRLQSFPVTSDSAAPDASYRSVAEAVARMGGCSVARLGLRFDRVVARVLNDLRLSSSAGVPEGSSVLFTITAPIRVPKRMVAALREEIAALLLEGGDGSERQALLHGSRVELRLVEEAARPSHKLLGFVHNPGVEGAQVLDLAEAWLRSEPRRA